MKIHGKCLFDEIRQKYDIDKIIAEDGCIYYRIKKGIYSLKQAARLETDKLVKHLKLFGYSPDIITPNL